MTAWISVKEFLPTEYEYVLVYSKMSGTNEPCPIGMARIKEGKWELLTNQAVACGDLAWDIDVKDITHWMPLPEAPEEFPDYGNYL